MATTVFRNGRAGRGLETPATGHSTAAQTYLGGKKKYYEPVSAAGWSLLLPEPGFPEAVAVGSFLEAAPLQAMPGGDGDKLLPC